MGFNTTLFIYNDALSDIEEHADEFIRNLMDHIQGMEESDIRAGSHVNAATVMKTGHADFPRLYYSGGNYMSDLSSPPYDSNSVSDRSLELLATRVKDAKHMLAQYTKFIKTEQARRKAQNTKTL